MGQVILLPTVMPDVSPSFGFRGFTVLVLSLLLGVGAWAVVIGALAGAWLVFDALLSLFRG